MIKQLIQKLEKLEVEDLRKDDNTLLTYLQPQKGNRQIRIELGYQNDGSQMEIFLSIEGNQVNLTDEDKLDLFDFFYKTKFRMDKNSYKRTLERREKAKKEEMNKINKDFKDILK